MDRTKPFRKLKGFFLPMDKGERHFHPEIGNVLNVVILSSGYKYLCG